MQHPTCSNVRIRSTSDAHKIFSAVQNGLLHMVTRRLDADERIALRSGCVYAWEERGPHSELTGLGIERFTEGRRWSPSRVRDEFLFYYEKYTPPTDASLPGNLPERQPPRDWDPLVKQTYSVWVETEKGRRKWHLTAYFTQATIDQLGTIDDNPLVRDLVVPEGTFKSTRVGKSRTSKTDDSNRSDAARAASTVPRTYAPFPTPYQYQAQHGSPSMTPVLMHEPYGRLDQRSPVEDHSPSPISPPPTHIPLTSSRSAPISSYVAQNHSLSPSAPHAQSVGPSDFHSRYPLNNFSPADSRHHHSPRASGGSWDETQHPYFPGQRTGYHQDDRRETIHPQYTSTSSPASYAAPVNYSQAIGPPHTYTSPGSGIPPLSDSHGNHVYSPSSSLHAALTLQDTDSRPYTLSPLQIPDRASPAIYAHVQIPRGQLNTPENERGADDEDLAPLEVLRRPGKFRREPMDEKTLRLLDENKRATS